MKKIIKDAMLVSSSMAAGMVLGMMFAPCSGKEMRKNIGKYADKMMKSDKCECNDEETTE